MNLLGVEGRCSSYKALVHNKGRGSPRYEQIRYVKTPYLLNPQNGWDTHDQSLLAGGRCI